MADKDMSKLTKVDRLTGNEKIVITHANTPTTNGAYSLAKLKEEITLQGVTQFNGELKPNSQASNIDGFWLVTEAGVYENYGGLELPPASFGFIIKKGDSFEISFTSIYSDDFLRKDEKIPNENLTFGEVKEGDSNVVSGGDVWKEFFKNKKTIGVFNNAFSSANSYLVMDYNFNNDFVKDVEIQVTEVGVAYIVILKRQTFENEKVDGGIDSFFEVKEIPFNVENGKNLLPLNIILKKDEYIGINGLKGVKPTWRNNLSIPVQNGWWQKVSRENYNLTYRNIDINMKVNVVNTVYAPIELFKQEEKKEVKITTIVVQKNVQNYNSIRTLLHSINDASEYNRYIIKVPKGVWYETDIFGKKYVELVGESITETILECDPTGVMADYLTPSDYHFVTQRNKPLKDVPLTNRHLFFANDDLTFKNMTVKANDCKYVCHLDSSRMGDVVAENVIIQERDCSYAIGIGIRGGQSICFKNFMIKSSSVGKSIFFHNTNNQDKGSVSTFENGKFNNCDLFMIDELGSNFDDILNIINCHSTLEKTSLEFMVDKHPQGGTYYIKPDGEREMNPTLVPYNIFLNTMGTKIDNVTSRKSGNFNPEWGSIDQRNTLLIMENQIGIW